MLLIMEKTQIYFFIEELNSINIPLLKKLKNISIIYRNYSKRDYFTRALKIKKFAKKDFLNLLKKIKRKEKIKIIG